MTVSVEDDSVVEELLEIINFTEAEREVLAEFGFDHKTVQELIDDPVFQEVLLTALDWVAFSQTFFVSPENIEERLILEEWQKDVMYYVQYGEKKDILLICPRGFGKSIVTSIIAACIMIFMPGVKIGLYAMGQKQSTDLLDNIRYFLKHSPFEYLLPQRGTGLDSNKERIQLTNRSDCRAYPCTDALRGRHNDIIILDEMSRIADYMINSVIRPTGRRAIREIGLSTPAGMTGEFYYNSLDTKNYKVFRVGALDVSWMTSQKLEAETRRLGPFAARQELYAEFLPTGDTLIPMEWVNKSYDHHRRRRVEFDKGYIEKAGRYMCMGVDFGRDRDRSVFAIGHKNPYAIFQLDYMESILKAPYTYIVNRIVELTERFRVKLIVPDATGLGEPAVDMLVYELSKRRLGTRVYHTDPKKRIGFIFTPQSKLDLIDNLMQTYADGKVSVPFHQNREEFETLHLERELISFQFEITNTGSAKPALRYGTQKDHDDRLIAHALWLWGLKDLRFKFHGMKTG